jgi:ribonuclease VapC
MAAGQAFVLDASALLAALFGEPGGDTVQGALTNAVISSVNWAEVLQKSLEQGKSIEGLQEELELMGLTILAFTPG